MMMERLGESAPGTELDIISRRSRPYVILLDAHLHVVCAEPRAFEFLAQAFPAHSSGSSLPEAVSSRIESAMRQRQARSLPPNGLVLTTGTLVMRVIALRGSEGAYISLLIEPQTRRDHLKRAVARYFLSKREVEVLTYIMQGQRSIDIAEGLCISPATVNDHFKSLLKKTGARSRAEMLVKIFES